MKKVSILGSTGSIGTQALDIINEDFDNFNVTALSCNSNIKLLEQQIKKFKPKVVVVFNNEKADMLKAKKLDVQVLSGLDGLRYITKEVDYDILVTSVVGNIGLLPTLDAVRRGKIIALANKETLVCAGEIIMKEAKKYDSKIIPVDSEHSAIFQCITSSNKTIEKLVLTASGGPFRELSREDICDKKAKEALKHPNWEMGNKISIDSATMMNKGLEVIEARWLFDITADNIDVIVHPQSIVHSMVEYIDTSVIAQMGLPDMRVPIAYALYNGTRHKMNYKSLSLTAVRNLTFEEPRFEVFPCLRLAYEAISVGGIMPTILNTTNEVAVEKYLSNEIKFYDISKMIENEMKSHKNIIKPTIEDILEIDQIIRKKYS